MFTVLFDTYTAINPNELSQEQIQNLKHEFKNPKPDTTSDEFLDFKLWCIKHPSRQETFAEYLAKKLPINTKILEVGCGRTARLSRFLSEKGFNMTAIDPQLNSIQEGIISIKDTFSQNSDIRMYDYVIGQEPCEATEHIVRACTAQKIPFLISLCGTPHKLISGQMPKNYEDWYNHLINISPSEIKLRYVKLDPFSQTPILKNF